MATGGEAGEADAAALAAPVLVQSRGVRVGDDLIVDGVVEIDRSDRDFRGHEAESAVLEDSGDGRLVENVLAKTLEISCENGEVGVSGKVVYRTVRGRVVQCCATLGSGDAIDDRSQLGSVCVVRRQTDDSSWQETGEGGVVDEQNSAGDVSRGTSGAPALDIELGSIVVLKSGSPTSGDGASTVTNTHDCVAVGRELQGGREVVHSAHAVEHTPTCKTPGTEGSIERFIVRAGDNVSLRDVTVEDESLKGNNGVGLLSEQLVVVRWRAVDERAVLGCVERYKLVKRGIGDQRLKTVVTVAMAVPLMEVVR